MRIRITDIPPAGLKIEEKLSLLPLKERMSGGREHDIEFTTEPAVSLTVFKTASGAETRGTVKTSFRQGCSRCDLMIEREIETTADFLFKYPEKASTSAVRPGMPQRLNETGINYIEGDYIELEELIQENLILSLSIYWSPELDSDEKCTHCHLDPGAFSKGPSQSDEPATFASLLQNIKPGKRTKK